MCRRHLSGFIFITMMIFWTFFLVFNMSHPVRQQTLFFDSLKLYVSHRKLHFLIPWIKIFLWLCICICFDVQLNNFEIVHPFLCILFYVSCTRVEFHTDQFVHFSVSMFPVRKDLTLRLQFRFFNLHRKTGTMIQ